MSPEVTRGAVVRLVSVARGRPRGRRARGRSTGRGSRRCSRPAHRARRPPVSDTSGTPERGGEQEPPLQAQVGGLDVAVRQPREGPRPASGVRTSAPRRGAPPARRWGPRRRRAPTPPPTARSARRRRPPRCARRRRRGPRAPTAAARARADRPAGPTTSACSRKTALRSVYAETPRAPLPRRSRAVSRSSWLAKGGFATTTSKPPGSSGTGGEVARLELTDLERRRRRTPRPPRRRRRTRRGSTCCHASSPTASPATSPTGTMRSAAVAGVTAVPGEVVPAAQPQDDASQLQHRRVEVDPVHRGEGPRVGPRWGRPLARRAWAASRCAAGSRKAPAPHAGSSTRGSASRGGRTGAGAEERVEGLVQQVLDEQRTG